MPSDRRRSVTPGFVIDDGPSPSTAVAPVTRPGVPADRPPRQRQPIDVIGRAVPAVEDLPLPRRRRRRRRSRDVDFATGFRNVWVAFWWNLWSVGRWCVLASAALFFGVGAWLGPAWGWAAAAVPLVGWALWMWVVVRQGVRHARGQAGPPPGWIGRL